MVIGESMPRQGHQKHAISRNNYAIYFNMSHETPVDVAILLTTRFPLLSMSICTESLRVANREAGELQFDRRLVSETGGPMTSSSGIEIAVDAAIDDVSRATVVIVLSSYRPEETATPKLLGWLRGLARRGAVIACVDTGSYLLAKAGLLPDSEIAVHHEVIPAYRELFDDASFSDRLSTFDGRVASSAGGMATLDMMMQLIARFSDSSLAERTLHVLNYRMTEDGRQIGLSGTDMTIGRVDRRLRRLIEMMQANIETPLTLSVLCRACHVDVSTATRLFERAYGQSPGRYYKAMRLERARTLLANSPLQVSTIADAVGFSNAAAFTRAFKQHFGELPSRMRIDHSGERT